MLNDGYVMYFDRYCKWYIGNLNSSSGIVIKSNNEVVVFIDDRYYEMIVNLNRDNDVKVISSKDNIHDVIIYLKGKNMLSVYVDFKSICYSDVKLFESNEIKLINNSSNLLRYVKSEKEIDIMSNLAEITNKAFELSLPHIKCGISERGLSEIIRSNLIFLGGDFESFEIIVAFKENSSIPHHKTSNKVLEANSNILIDFGLRKDKYVSDLTRNVFFGTPSKQYLKAYYMVYKAQELVLKGRFKKICELQQCAIEFFTNNGVRSNYLHNLGHSIGYSVHEYPYLNDTDDSALVDNIILTIEPGLYFKGDFGIRIEDMVVSCGGRLKPFSSSSKEVICLEIK